ncbi:MAG: TetR/AcrR family transcriptional regulator [Clostridia bacterium]|jgi:AcrR family transcriptional regulator
MPKKTFLNLSEKQKDKIIEIALKEFSEHDFKSASLNNIINSLDVTKGSFYRYFESKKELYDFLAKYASEKKLTFIKKSISQKYVDFFEQFKSIMYSFLIFDMTFPVYGRFLLNIKYYNGMEAFLKEAISEALKAGTLSSEFDRDFIFTCLVKVTQGVEDYISQSTGTNREKLLSMTPSADIHDDKGLQNIFDKTIEFLKHGFGARQ